MTVSRALSGNTEVSERTRKKVLLCATALGYQPNRWARSLVTRRSSIIGVVIPDISHSFFAEITFGIEEVLERAGYDILLCHSRGSTDRERSELDMLMGSRVEGLIVASEQPEKAPGPIMTLLEKGVPFVLIDRFFPNTQTNTVRVDDQAVGELATQCLIDLGHVRIAHIGGPPISPARLRRRGYMKAMKGAGLFPEKRWIAGATFDLNSGLEAGRRLLQLSPRPTAIFGANDPISIGAVYACRELGLRVPEDISIVGAGNIEGRHHPNPFLTTVDWPREDLGRTAAAILLKLIDRPSRECEVNIFEPKLIVRQSTARRVRP